MSHGAIQKNKSGFLFRNTVYNVKLIVYFTSVLIAYTGLQSWMWVQSICGLGWVGLARKITAFCGLGWLRFNGDFLCKRC